MRKYSIPALLLLLGTAAANGQSVPGTWKTLPMQGTGITTVVETPSKVFYVSGHHSDFKLDNSFYIYDKESNENSYATPGVSLSDGGVKSIKYNPAGKYLLAAYSNGNIDLIYDSGKVVNLPEIKNASVSGSKGINDITFADGKIYVATDFGIVIYDDAQLVVSESGIFNVPVLKIGVMGDRLLIYGLIDAANPTKYSLQTAPLAGHHNSLDRFTVLRNDVSINDWFIPGDRGYITIGGSGAGAAIVRVDIADNGDFSFTTLASVPNATEFKRCDTGYYCVASDRIVFLDENGTVTSTQSMVTTLQPATTGLWNSNLKTVWAAEGNALGCYDLSSGSSTVVASPYEMEGFKTFNNSCAALSSDGKVYINGAGQSEYYPLGDAGWGLHIPLFLASYNWETGEITQEYPELTTQFSSSTKAEQNKFKINTVFGGAGKTVIDPVDPSLIYLANNYDGLFLIRNREVVFRFHAGNSPLFTRSGVARVHDVVFDNDGNLWVGMWRGGTASNSSTKVAYKMLPKESLQLARTNPEALTALNGTEYTYWQQPAWVDSDQGKCDVRMAFSGNKGIKIDGSWNDNLIGVDTKGTTTVSDDVYVKYNGFTDQDGTTSNPSKQGCITVDKNGWFWIGTVSGLFVIKDIDQIGTQRSTLAAVRPKVAREDGTDYADYLLASEIIYNIAVDANNNKWIATAASGVYCVNEDGTKILEHFYSSNSPMRTNTVTSVACNPNGNDVLIGTTLGMYVYGSTSTPAADNFDEVKVYPNPVRPDYTGWITIEGLMANSLIKIVDASGNTLWNGRSEGGMCRWDGCDASGNRVRSGVYFVYASQNSDGNSGAVVAKIVVVN